MLSAPAQTVSAISAAMLETTNTLPVPLMSAGCDCQTCGRFVAFRPCQSNTNGNRGRLVAVVCEIHSNLEYMLMISPI